MLATDSETAERATEAAYEIAAILGEFAPLDREEILAFALHEIVFQTEKRESAEKAKIGAK